MKTMKGIILTLFLGSILSVDAGYVTVKGVLMVKGSANWSSFTSNFEVVGFSGDDLLLREWNPATIGSSQQGRSMNGSRVEVTSRVIKSYTGLLVELVHYPYPSQAKLNADLTPAPDFPWCMIRTGTHDVRGINYVVYDLGEPAAGPPARKLTAGEIASIQEQARIAFTNVLIIAQAPDAMASTKYSIGLRYLTANGCSRDFDQAISWMLKAADQGDDEASAKLTSLADKLQQAANQGNLLAANDAKTLRSFLQKSADAGDAKASQILASIKK